MITYNLEEVCKKIEEDSGFSAFIDEKESSLFIHNILDRFVLKRKKVFSLSKKNLNTEALYNQIDIGEMQDSKILSLYQGIIISSPDLIFIDEALDYKHYSMGIKLCMLGHRVIFKFNEISLKKLLDYLNKDKIIDKENFICNLSAFYLFESVEKEEIKELLNKVVFIKN